VVQSTAFTPQGNLELRVYPGPDCSGHLYMDDGHTFNYKQGESLNVTMSCNSDARGMSLTLDAAQGTYKPWFSAIDVVFIGATAAATGASLDGKSISTPTYDAAHHAIQITIPYTGQAQKLNVQF
jgi:alpha-glucosidase